MIPTSYSVATLSIALDVSTNSVAILVSFFPPSNLKVSSITYDVLFLNFSLFIIAHILSLLNVLTLKNLNLFLNLSLINSLATLITSISVSFENSFLLIFF